MGVIIQTVVAGVGGGGGGGGGWKRRKKNKRRRAKAMPKHAVDSLVCAYIYLCVVCA